MSAQTPALPQQQSPAKPLTAIQTIEQEFQNFIRQREQAVANVHAIDGAIQAAQHLLAKLKAEEAKAAAEVKKLASGAVSAIEGILTEAEAKAGAVITVVEKDAQGVEKEVPAVVEVLKDNVVSIDSAKKA